MSDFIQKSFVFAVTLAGPFFTLRYVAREKARAEISTLDFALQTRSHRMTPDQIAKIHLARDLQTKYIAGWSIFLRPRVDWIDLDVPGFQAHLWPVGSRN